MLQLFKQPYYRKNYTHEEAVAVLENKKCKKIRYIVANWKIKTSKEIARDLGISETTVFRIGKGKVGKKPRLIKYRNHQETVLVLNSETGIYYHSFSSAAKSVGIPRQTMRDIIRGEIKRPGLKHWKIV